MGCLCVRKRVGQRGEQAVRDMAVTKCWEGRLLTCSPPVNSIRAAAAVGPPAVAGVAQPAASREVSCRKALALREEAGVSLAQLPQSPPGVAPCIDSCPKLLLLLSLRKSLLLKDCCCCCTHEGLLEKRSLERMPGVHPEGGASLAWRGVLCGQENGRKRVLSKT